MTAPAAISPVRRELASGRPVPCFLLSWATNAAVTDVVKAFPSFVTFALSWAQARPSALSTYSLARGSGDPCYWLARLLLLNWGWGWALFQPFSLPRKKVLVSRRELDALWELPFPLRPFLLFQPGAKKFFSFISVTCSLTLYQSGVRAMEDEGKWGMERREGKWEKFWRPNSHKKQPSNGYCCRKGRNIKYKTETAASIYGADYRRINQSGYLARAVATRQKPRDLQQSHAALWAASDPRSVHCDDIQDAHGETFPKPQKILSTEPMWCTESQIVSLTLFSATVYLKDAVTVTVFLFLVELN